MGKRRIQGETSLLAISHQLTADYREQQRIKKQIKEREEKKLVKQNKKKALAARIPYKSYHRILLLGEGNFSFAHSLLKVPLSSSRYAIEKAVNNPNEEEMEDDSLENTSRKRLRTIPSSHTPSYLPPHYLAATAYDSEDQVHTKYPDAAAHINALKESGAKVEFGIDATKLHTYISNRNDLIPSHIPLPLYTILMSNRRRKTALESIVTPISPPPCLFLPRSFHRIVFNFPHTGCGIKDTEENNQLHREFITQMLQSIVTGRLVKSRDNDGQIHLTIKSGEPYTSWRLPKLAKPIKNLHFLTSFPFHPHLYDGYEHRRTIGYIKGISIEKNEEISKGTMTYVYVRDREEDEESDDEKDEIQQLKETKITSNSNSQKQNKKRSRITTTEVSTKEEEDEDGMSANVEMEDESSMVATTLDTLNPTTVLLGSKSLVSLPLSLPPPPPKRKKSKLNIRDIVFHS